MPLTLNIGTLDIANKEVEKFIKTKSIDEVRTLIVDFLTNQALNNKPKKKMGKWANVASQMQGTLSDDTVNYLSECSKEVRNGFEFRELDK